MVHQYRSMCHYILQKMTVHYFQVVGGHLKRDRACFYRDKLFNPVPKAACHPFGLLGAGHAGSGGGPVSWGTTMKHKHVGEGGRRRESKQ